MTALISLDGDVLKLRGPLGSEGSYQYQYLTGESSLSSLIPSQIQVGDLFNVSAYSESSCKLNASWECTSLSASLPAGAVAGEVIGLAMGALYVLKEDDEYYKFELVDSPRPEHFGARADGIEDDTQTLLAALNTGRPVDGHGVTLAVSGSVEPALFAGLQNIEIKQLDPGAVNCRTLKIRGLSNFFIKNVRVDRNGGYTTGSMADSAGLWIDESPDNFVLEDVHVYNGGPGNGIFIDGGTNFALSRCFVRDHIHDIGATDDVINGIWFNGCHDFRLTACEVRNLAGAATVRYTRGFAFGGCSNFAVSSCIADQVDQCFDVTGTYGNQAFTFGNCIADNGGTFGFKFANSAHNGNVTGCIARRIGLKGFVVTGQTSALNPKPRDIRFSNCHAIDTGSNGLWPATSTQGFRVESVATIDPSYPRGIIFDGCTVVDNQTTPTTKNGFANDVAPIEISSAGYDKPDSNYCINCNVVGLGSPGDAYVNIHHQAGVYQATSTKSFPDSSWATADFNNDLYDPAKLHNTAVQSSNINIKTPGIYLITATLIFESAATGLRKMRFSQNGVTAMSPEFEAAAHSSGKTTVQGSIPIACNSGDSVRVQGWQNSGAALNLAAGCSLSIVRIS